MILKLVVFFVYVLVSCTCLSWPESIKKCDRKQNNFDDCLKEAVEDAFRKGKTSVDQIGLSVTDPVEIPALVIGAGSGAVSFSQNYTNMKLYGISDAKCSNIKMDFDKKQLWLDCSTPLFKLVFDYDIKGKILLLPIYGHGPGTIDIENLNFNLKINLEEYEKKGKKHFKVVNQKLILTPQRIKFDLKNLFDGEKALSDNVLQVMNDNWSEVFGDVKTSYEDAFGQIFSNIFEKVAQKVPISDMFGHQ